jgi:hypothetical protein
MRGEHDWLGCEVSMIGWAKRRLGLGHATHNERALRGSVIEASVQGNALSMLTNQFLSISLSPANGQPFNSLCIH